MKTNTKTRALSHDNGIRLPTGNPQINEERVYGRKLFDTDIPFTLFL